MRHAGFVLTGGQSSRMGQDKALLPWGSRKLVEHVAGEVLQAAGNVALIGSPELYGHLGYPVYPDCVSDCGPVGGMYTALSLQAEWNLILACDLPEVTATELRKILQAAESAPESTDCVVPVDGANGAQPLCAAYHCRCLQAFESALRESRLKLTRLLESLRVLVMPGLAPELFVNVNTPTDWERIEEWRKA